MAFCCITSTWNKQKKIWNKILFTTNSKNFGIFFMGSGSLTLEDFFKTLFSQLIWQYEISLFTSPAWQAEGNGWGNVLEFIFFSIQSTQLCLIGLKKYVCLWKWRCKLGAINFDYLDSRWWGRKKKKRNTNKQQE